MNKPTYKPIWNVKVIDENGNQTDGQQTARPQRKRWNKSSSALRLGEHSTTK